MNFERFYSIFSTELRVNLVFFDNLFYFLWFTLVCAKVLLQVPLILPMLIALPMRYVWRISSIHIFVNKTLALHNHSIISVFQMEQAIHL